jgi:hypothetical protein
LHIDGTGASSVIDIAVQSIVSVVRQVRRCVPDSCLSEGLLFVAGRGVVSNSAVSFFNRAVRIVYRFDYKGGRKRPITGHAGDVHAIAERQVKSKKEFTVCHF